MKIHNFKFATILGIFLSFSLLGIDYLSAQTVWLDQLDLSTATQGYGIPMKNKSIDGKTLTIAGQTFERGFGSHSESSLTILLEGKATLFTAQVGIDDEVKGQKPAAEFIVFGDNKKLWTSGVMSLGDAAKPCSVKLDGVKKLELVVNDGGNGNYYDHVDWVDAKFQTTGVTTFKTFSPVATEPYILTSSGNRVVIFINVMLSIPRF